MPELTKEQKIILIAAALVTAASFAFSFVMGSIGRKDLPITITGAPSTSHEASSAVFVHVAGAVRMQGVFKLPCGSRMLDAIKAAGGCVRRADLNSLNLAEPLKDGTRIVVPFMKTGPAAVLDNATSGPFAAEGAIVNINTADEAGLQKIPGVGKVTAERIITYRKANGPFSSIDDLKKIGGIGDKKLERMKPVISVN